MTGKGVKRAYPKYTNLYPAEVIYLQTIDEIVVKAKDGAYCKRLYKEDNIIAYIAQLSIRIWEDNKKAEMSKKTLEND